MDIVLWTALYMLSNKDITNMLNLQRLCNLPKRSAKVLKIQTVFLKSVKKL